MSFSVTGPHVYVVLFYFVYPFIGAGAHGWVVDIAGHGSGSILQGLGLLANYRVVLDTWPPLVMNVVYYR